MFSAERPRPEHASNSAASLPAQRRAPAAAASDRTDGRCAAGVSHWSENAATGPVSQVLDAGPVDLPLGREQIGSRRHLLRTLDRVRPYLATSSSSRPAGLSPLADADRGTAERITDSVMNLVDHPVTGARAQLRASLTAYVSCLRGDRLPPERMLVLVKSAVAELLVGATRDRLGVIAYRTILADVVRWSIEAYYGPPDAR